MNLLDLMIKIGVDDQASDKVAGIGSNIVGGLGKAVGTVAKVGAAAVAAGTAAAVALGKASVDAYAENEQLWGGVQKLYGAAGMSADEYAQSVGKSVDEIQGEYGRLRQAEGLVAQNAQNAFRTAGMSANEYMTNATQFSASLINSLGGDTVKAAELTDVAMRAISDNVNTFGSDAEAVTNAVIGLSRQNYTMIDNLKLGYSGTAQGMLELINDSGVLGKELTNTSELAGVGFDKMIEAIQAVQEQQGIAGTTAREAATTIEGSIGMARGAWTNFLTELGKEDGDVGARMGEFMDSVMTVMVGSVNENGEKVSDGIMGVVRRIVSGLKDAAPEIMRTVSAVIDEVVPVALDLLADALPMILSIMGQVFATIGSTLPSLFQKILPVLASQIVLLINVLAQNMPALFAAAGQLFSMIGRAIIQYGPMLLAALWNLLTSLVTTVIENVPEMLKAAMDFLKAMLDGFKKRWPDLKAWISKVPSWILSALGNLVSKLLQKGRDVIDGIKNGAVSRWDSLRSWVAGIPSRILSAIGNVAGTLAQKGRDLINGMRNGLVNAWGTVSGWVAGIPSRILGALGGVGGLLYNAGSAIINSLKNGMVSAFTSVKNWVSGVASTIKSLKGPLPYDRTVLIDNGEALMAGLQKGLSIGFESDVKPYVESMAGQMSDAFNVPSVSAHGAVQGKYGPTLSLTIQNMTVRNRDDAEYMAQRISHIWTREIGGSL